jgi:hypothetical protein
MLANVTQQTGAGRIIDGQGTGTIHVDTTELAGQTVTATLTAVAINKELMKEDLD